MNSILRRLRGGVGTALTWGVLWTLPGAVFGAVVAAILGPNRLAEIGEAALALGLVSGAAGIASGALFSLLLGTVYRERRLDELGPGMMAVWGAGAAISVPALLTVGALVSGSPTFPAELALAAIFVGTAGALSAGGTVKIAQSAPGSRARLSSDTSETLP